MNSGTGESPLSSYEARSAFVWTIVFLVLALLAVLGRLASQHLKGTKLGHDDFLIVAGTAVYFVQGIMVFLTIFTGGVGHFLSDLQEPEKKLKNLLRLVTLIQYPYGVCMGLIRCSILVLILRIFGLVASKRFKVLVYVALVITMGQVLYVVLNASLLCRPFEANWNKIILEKNPNAKCRNATTSFVVVAAWGIFCDIIIFLLPIPQTMKLVLGKRQRTLLFLVFGLGIADIIVGSIRIVTVTNSGLNNPNTITVNVAQGIIWGMAEPSIAVMVACGPTLWLLIDKWIPSHLKSWASSIVRSAKSVNKKVRSASDQTSFGQMDDQIELVLQEEGHSSQITSSRATPRRQE